MFLLKVKTEKKNLYFTFRLEKVSLRPNKSITLDLFLEICWDKVEEGGHLWYTQI